MTATVCAKAEITNACICEMYDEDTDTSSPAEYCYGDCYSEQEQFALYEVILPWAESVATEKGWLAEDEELEVDCCAFGVSGRAMGWQRLEGRYTASGREIIRCLELDRAEFRLVFIREDDTLSVIRYSHDEPTGALFAIDLLEVA
jgi:hypothetical protein